MRQGGGRVDAPLGNHLFTLADSEDKTIQEVLDASAQCLTCKRGAHVVYSAQCFKCKPGVHVHWLTARGRERSTSEEGVKKILRNIRKTRPAGPATPPA